MQDKPLSLRLMKLTLAAWWWALILGTAIFVLLVLTTSASNLSFAIQGYASDLDTSAFAAVDREGRELNFEFDRPLPVKFLFSDEAEETTIGLGLRLLGIGVILPCFFVGLYFVKQLRDIVRTIDDNDPFADENAGRIRMIGILIFAFEILVCLGRLVMSGIADVVVRPTGFNLNGRIELNESLLVVALAMLVLSEVFRHGARIRQEQSLTI